MIVGVDPEPSAGTTRSSLRLHRESDLERLVSIYSRPDVARFLLEEPWTLESGAAHLQRRLARTGLDGPSGSLALAVEREGTLIGAVSVWRTEQEPRTVEVGWTLDPAHGGNGYATEAVAAVLDLAFERHDAHRAVARMDARNEASARLASRLGMRREAHFRSDFWSKGEWTDTVVFAMLASDRRPSQAPG
jgi:RimJ/RimL family protein N-acetyltransferase